MLENERVLWPDVIGDTERRMIHLEHTIILTRKEFDNSIGNVARLLLNHGTLDLDGTSDVRKYTFEIEIVD